MEQHTIISVIGAGGKTTALLALARALLSPFDALALDEPLAGLDPENRRRALECIRRNAQGRPVLLVTHDEADQAFLQAAAVWI